ncbi:hypothetical protein [Pedobacter caeni]|uniref:DUF3828 domain-containing protein n=1 Tax=Pedobacter caeni TaxID=288992 RepID=A0A1M5NDC1_9SPHI|nr:hypothetical protein [Pedobacter caeni]SHG87510.1 hypothetical protein SAMN04488522_10896 [Pedobacter caeni]
MKVPVIIVAAFFFLFKPGLILAQQGPAATMKKLFLLLDKPNDLINKENECFAKMDGLDVLKLNKPFVKTYLTHLKNTGLFSRAYLAAQHKAYQDLEKSILKDGSAIFRDSDIYTLSQDPPSSKELLASLQKSSPLISGTTALITLVFKNYQGYKLIYKLVKEGGYWRIDQINAT